LNNELFGLSSLSNDLQILPGDYFKEPNGFIKVSDDLSIQQNDLDFR